MNKIAIHEMKYNDLNIFKQPWKNVDHNNCFHHLDNQKIMKGMDRVDHIEKNDGLANGGGQLINDTESRKRRNNMVEGRRQFLHVSLALSSFEFSNSIKNAAAFDGSTVVDGESNKSKKNIELNQPQIDFRSSGFSKQEYTNSITASRDTNISPKEAYDTISSAYISKQPIEDALSQNRVPTALDLGAGAGVSTQLLYDMGYKDIDAVDWSGDAWRKFVEEDEEENTKGDIKGGVRFWEMDDERFVERWRDFNNLNNSQSLSSSKQPNIKRVPAKGKYDAIVFNFAVNESKAKSMASEMLTDTGKLLAPVNVQNDYWLKQTYQVYDKAGTLLWQAGDIGAWSVQFQPDVTQDSCQGIWCAPFNGFQKQRK